MALWPLVISGLAMLTVWLVFGAKREHVGRAEESCPIPEDATPFEMYGATLIVSGVIGDHNLADDA